VCGAEINEIKDELAGQDVVFVFDGVCYKG
jgi:hypothetical protein